jgi:hypothetical protein
MKDRKGNNMKRFICSLTLIGVLVICSLLTVSIVGLFLVVLMHEELCGLIINLGKAIIEG